MTDGYPNRLSVAHEASSEIATPLVWDARLANARSDRFRAGFTGSDKLLVLSQPDGIAAESIGSLRSHLQANHMREGRRSLALCAATAQVGTSFITANLAVSLAMSGANTLLVDGNLRDPSLHKYVIPSARVAGLREYLAEDRLGLDDVLQRGVMPNLSLVYSSAAGPDVHRLLSKRKLDALFDTAMRDFDIVIVDTPGSSRFGDARRIAAAVHHSMIVVRKSHSFVSDIKALLDELNSNRVNVIGSFLNDFADRGA